MRLDDFLSTVGVIKRRTIAKELASNGMIEANAHRVKPAYQVKIDDIISVKGTNPFRLKVLDIPRGSVSRDERDHYYQFLSEPEI